MVRVTRGVRELAPAFRREACLALRRRGETRVAQCRRIGWKAGVQPRHKAPREAYLRTGVIGMGSLACTPAYRAVRAARPGQARAANSGAKAPHSIRTASPVECGRLLALSFEGLSLFSTRGLLALSFEGFLRFRREMVVASAGGAVVLARHGLACRRGRQSGMPGSGSPTHKSRETIDSSIRLRVPNPSACPFAPTQGEKSRRYKPMRRVVG